MEDGLDYLATKNIYWRHESERRYMVRRDLDNDEGDFIADGNYFQFNEQSLRENEGLIKAVYLGLNTPKHKAESIIHIIENSNKGVKIYESGINVEHYSLEFRCLDI